MERKEGLGLGAGEKKERGKSGGSGVVSTPCPFLFAGLDSSKIENGLTVFVADWARGEARGSQEAYETLGLWPRSAAWAPENKCGPGWEGRHSP